MLDIKDLTFYYKKNLIFKDVNIKVLPGEIVSILGLNGSGKISLLKAIARINKPNNGIILVENKNIFQFKGKELAKIIGYLPQKSQGEYIKVFDAILLGRKVFFNLIQQKKIILQ